MALSGLVSYGSSDESDDDEPDTSTISVSQSTSKSSIISLSDVPCTSAADRNFESLIDDSAVDDVAGPSMPSGLGLPAPKYSEIEDTASDTTPVSLAQGASTGLLPLPNPNRTRASDVVDAEDEVEDEVEEEFKRLPQTAELPKPRKKTGKVKISLPSLPTYDSDEDDEPKVKKPRPTGSGKSGLLGMLPQPKHVSVKESNRPLIPHALSKKPVAKPVPKPAASGARLVDVASDSDEDNDNPSFFTFANNNKNSHTVSSGFRVQAAPVTDEEPLTVNGPLKFVASTKALFKTPSTFVNAKASPRFDENFAATSIDQYQNNYEPNNYSAAGAEGYDYESAGTAKPVDFETHQQLLQDDQFKRMCGKNFRGEEINIVEVHADDQMSSNIDFTKSLTEEKSDMSYSKKRKDLPSSLSRRKHQITYLAFQAKERELELKNQWSQNKLTKRQTQAKYGF